MGVVVFTGGVNIRIWQDKYGQGKEEMKRRCEDVIIGLLVSYILNVGPYFSLLSKMHDFL